MKKVLIVSDNEYQVPQVLEEKLKAHLKGRGFQIEQTQISRGDIAFCMGCFGCWIKKPGECVMADAIGLINKTSMQSDVVIYLCPVVFGQFSANIKDVIDRWLPNMLPFFITRKDGSTMHPPRYESYPKQIMIGYGDAITDEDAQLFIDINKHRLNAQTLIFRGNNEESIIDEIEKTDLSRIGAVL